MCRAFEIRDMTTDYIERPFGIDHGHPVFSWRMEAGGNGRFQKAYQIRIFEEDTEYLVWDSGCTAEPKSVGIVYQGAPLKPRKRYRWLVRVWNEADVCLEKESVFETGFMDSSMRPWDGATFISTPGHDLRASVKGVFRIEAEIRIPEDSSSGGIVFGAGDRRLLQRHENLFGLSGEHYISYVIDLMKEQARLLIYRVGYSKEDRVDIPLAEVPICDPETGWEIITRKNCHDYHKLTVEVYGNHARAFVDGICVDEVKGRADGRTGRILNPLGIHDVINFPRMNEVGFLSGGGELHIRSLKLSNIRKPGAVLAELSSAGEGGSLEKVYLEKGLRKEADHYVLESEQGMNYVTVLPDQGSVPLLRRRFITDKSKKLAAARCYVTARGIYEGTINGKRMSDEFFAPGGSQPDRHLYYQVYDMTEDLQSGKNRLEFLVASGWWSDSQTYETVNHNYYGDKPSLMAKIYILYEDGTEETIGTDTESWECTKDGPYRYAGFYNGEHYDARKSGLSRCRWEKPAAVQPAPISGSEKHPEWPAVNLGVPEIVCRPEKGVGAAGVIQAKTCKEAGHGVYIYDMGQNMAGVPRIRFHEPEGTQIILRYSEVLYPDMEAYSGLEGNIMTENLRDADCTDIYICNGAAAGEVYMPRLTFHGYRYVEITGISRAPEAEEVEGVLLSSVREFAGRIETSDADINRLFNNICNSQQSNFISIPTDCPQRNERLGWLGDAQVFAGTALYNADVQMFMRRYLQAVRDLQEENGRFPDIAPMGGGFGGIAWGCAGIIIPWELWQQYGDRSIIEEQYDAMKKYTVYLNEHREEELVNDVGKLGDWLAVDDKTDDRLLWDAIYAYVLKLMVYMTNALGRHGADEYENLYSRTRAKWNEVYIDPVSGKTRTRAGVINDTQCSYALPLAYGIIQDNNQQKVAEHLNRVTVECGCRLMTGFLGTGLISRALCDHGYADTAYRLLKQKQYPSWLYPVTQGATTIWERWNSYTEEAGFGGNNAMNSFNHYSLGAVGGWMYTHMLGIRRDESQPGFRRFILKPVFGDLDYVQGAYKGIYGEIRAGWHRQEDKICYKVTVPPNTEAAVILPERGEMRMGSGTYEFVI